MSFQAEILAPSEANLERVADYLRGGQVVGVPTETVYGLAGNALDEAAVRKIFEVKGRPLIDPLIVHFSSLQAATKHAIFNDRALELVERFWPGALTLVLAKKPSIPDLVTAGMPSVAIRVPGHPVFHSLLEKLDFPLAAPSANPFGYVSPTLAEHVQATLGERIPAILDGGACQHGVESTIVDLRDPDTPKILRPGPISAEALGILSATITSSAKDDASAQSAPGMLTQHYSPRTPITLFNHGSQPRDSAENEAVIFNAKPETIIGSDVFWLSENGDLNEIAHNLFMLIQKLDAGSYARIHVERAAAYEIGVAVNDRLTRAAAKRL